MGNFDFFQQIFYITSYSLYKIYVYNMHHLYKLLQTKYLKEKIKRGRQKNYGIYDTWINPASDVHARHKTIKWSICIVFSF